MMYGRPNHTLITTMERAEGADEGPERSQARTKQRKPSQKVILVCLQHERLSTEVSRDTSRDMAGEVGRDPLLQRYRSQLDIHQQNTGFTNRITIRREPFSSDVTKLQDTTWTYFPIQTNHIHACTENLLPDQPIRNRDRQTATTLPTTAL